MADALGAGSLLVVAGAGFGKTTAIEAAVQRSGLTSAWVRCSEGDDAGTLMARILGALRRAMPGAQAQRGDHRRALLGQRVAVAVAAAANASLTIGKTVPFSHVRSAAVMRFS
jgi:ATP/maltotriose-dependent transcriptional regulator MalT